MFLPLDCRVSVTAEVASSSLVVPAILVDLFVEFLEQISENESLLLCRDAFTLTATDVAGNTSTQTATFAVIYNFIGFLPPVPNDGSGVFKLGSTVPVKFQLTDAKGVLISTAVAHLTLQMLSGGTPVGTPIDATAPGNADVGDLFRFDGTQYIFNLSTKPLTVGTWQFQARLDDGTVHTVAMGTK